MYESFVALNLKQDLKPFLFVLNFCFLPFGTIWKVHDIGSYKWIAYLGSHLVLRYECIVWRGEFYVMFKSISVRKASCQFWTVGAE